MVHISTEAGGGGAGAAPVVGEEPDGGVESGLSPDRTPTNEAPSTPLQSGETNSLHLSQNKYWTSRTFDFYIAAQIARYQG